MIYFLIGHRGVGKSSLLSRINYYFIDRVSTFDLDQEIEKKNNKTISEIFKTNGEATFRGLELSALNTIIEKLSKNKLNPSQPIIIALGAGFPIQALQCPFPHELIWIKRVTDKLGRIFFDRPSIFSRSNGHEHLLNESLTLYKNRNPVFEKVSSLELIIPEGWDKHNQPEKTFWEILIFNQKNAVVSDERLKLIKPFVPITKKLSRWTHFLLNLNLQLELRTDLLPWKTIVEVIRTHGSRSVLVSIRSAISTKELNQIPKETRIDLAFEYAGMASELPTFYSFSLHEKNSIHSFFQFIQEHPHFKPEVLKIAPELSLLELPSLFNESSAIPIAFLPRSVNPGEFHWYRIWRKFNLPIQFVTLGDTGQEDLPLFFDWLRYEKPADHFAAVLGCPVTHSRSPATHDSFFKNEMNHEPFFPITVQKEEYDQAIPFLSKIGLKYAAITSPLKDSEGNNTWVLPNSKTNTDTHGLIELFSIIRGNALVWGGGGTLKGIETALQSHSIPYSLYSARTGKLRVNQDLPLQEHSTVIWACRHGETAFPTMITSPALVIDLSYMENSVARQYAIQTGAKYVSGIKLFEKQAEMQQVFWKKNKF